MKKKILLLLIFFVYNLNFGQEFELSKNYSLSKFEYTQFIKLQSEKIDFNGYMPIYLNDKNGNKLKEIEVFAETYDNDGNVQECNQVKLSNIIKIINVNIAECTSICDNRSYYWLLNNNGNLIDLPIIEYEDYELEMKFKNYEFLESDKILLVEYQDEFIEKGNYSINNIRRKSRKILETYIWNGKNILKI